MDRQPSAWGLAHPKALRSKGEEWFPSLLPSSLTEVVSQSKENCSLKAAAYNPVNYYYPKYPHLKMIMLQRNFPECLHLASRCHMFPRGGRTGSQGTQGEHYKALSTGS